MLGRTSHRHQYALQGLPQYRGAFSISGAFGARLSAPGPHSER
jgi:hypothetical protein